MKIKRISNHSRRTLWTIECNWVIWYAECKRLSRFWKFWGGRAAGTGGRRNVPQGIGETGGDWPALSCQHRTVRHYTECAGCYAAYPAVQATSGTLFQSRLNQGGQRTAPADKPQVAALPGKIPASHGNCITSHKTCSFQFSFPVTKCQRVSYNARLARLQKG